MLIPGIHCMKKLVLLFLNVQLCGLLAAQSYPQVIRPGETKTISSVKDSLWILNNHQFNNALACKEKLNYSDSINAILGAKAVLLNRIILAKDSTIINKDTLYHHYLNLWQVSDVNLEKSQKKEVVMKKRLKLFSVSAALIGFLLAFILIKH